MNVISALKTFGSGALQVAEANSPAIFAGLAIGCLVVGSVTAAMAMPKAMEDLKAEEERRAEAGEEPISSMPKLKRVWTVIKKCWKRFAPTTLIVVLGIGSVICSYRILKAREVAALTALATTAQQLNDRIKAEEVLTSKEKEKLKGAVADAKLKHFSKPDDSLIPHVGSGGNTLFVDYHSGRFFRTNVDYIERCLTELKNRQDGDKNEYYCETSMNDWYDILGLDQLPDFDHLIFDVNTDGYAELDWSRTASMPDTHEPCGIISFRVMPKWDFRTDVA